ncbi:hypothetical protein GC089_12300 [Cellulomonas sp. JZ18]|uniref:hypothetical protein n=1 Tax=Cellulomonas sp. JZ18 TaxID=2654191 RepID=UPI0012D3ACEF|nr:hypothetical protein [Cellulomonas sp. JZ18]QGQ19856.1 hypothetical protein GC089_12300 [Cellulomonas sp. JZ18]
MGRNLHLHNMVHARVHADVALDGELDRVADATAGGGGLLGDMNLHSDTMFNSFQLQRVIDELDVLARDRPDLRDDANKLREVALLMARSGGYFWIVGD